MATSTTPVTNTTPHLPTGYSPGNLKSNKPRFVHNPPLGTTPPGADSHDSRVLYITLIVGGIVLITVLIFLVLYCRKRRHPATEAKQPHSDDDAENVYTPPPSYDNRGMADHGMELGYASKETFTPLKENRPTQDLEFFNVSIKLLGVWNKSYTDKDSDLYIKMKESTERSIDGLYLDYRSYQSATVIGFREGSVIADVRLTFVAQAKNPLLIIKEAVKFGRFSDLEVDRNFFLDGNKKSERIESGYGSQCFEMPYLLSPHRPSQRSTRSADSCASDHSLRSSSSVNLSIHNTADDEIVKREKNARLKEKVKTLVKMEKKKPDENKSVPHVVLFDFHPRDFRELPLKQGEILQISYVDNGGWAKGSNKAGKQGWVPQNFIVPIDIKEYENTKKAVESLMFLDTMIDSSVESTSIDTSHDETQRGNEVQLSDTHSDDTGSSLFIAIYPFEPTERNELALELGDLVDVMRTSETGWWKGKCLRSKVDGWFPSSYIRPQPSYGTSEDKGSVSDSEVHSVAANHQKKQYDHVTGYCSDNALSKEKIQLKVDETCEDKDKGEEEREFGEVHLRIIEKIRDENQRTLTEAELNDLKAKRVIECHRRVHSDFELEVKSTSLKGTLSYPGDPPSKPVPPKPRKRHIQDKIRSLASFRQNEPCETSEPMKIEASEVAAPKMPIEITVHPHEELKTQTLNRVQTRTHKKSLTLGGIGSPKMEAVKKPPRPLSFQDIPQSNFLLLSSKYANTSMKPARSFPSLTPGEQVKLSPDDDRPFLEPIPRKNKRHSMPEVASPLAFAFYEKSESKTNGKLALTNFVNIAPSEAKKQTDEPLHRKVTSTSSAEKKSRKSKSFSKQNKLESSSRRAHRRFANVDNTIFEETEGADDMRARAENAVHKRYHSAPDTSPEVSPRSDDLSHDGDVSMDSSEDFSSRSSEHNELTSIDSPPSPTRLGARAVSSQSLASSTASSARSNASSKHEQMNLRRAVVAVNATSDNHLSFAVGAILYELRPRNKDGLSFGILEDSTQGWYPADAVEAFYDVC